MNLATLLFVALSVCSFATFISTASTRHVKGSKNAEGLQLKAMLDGSDIKKDTNVTTSDTAEPFQKGVDKIQKVLMEISLLASVYLEFLALAAVEEVRASTLALVSITCYITSLFGSVALYSDKKYRKKSTYFIVIAPLGISLVSIYFLPSSPISD